MVRSFERLQRTGVGFDTSNTYDMFGDLPFGPSADSFFNLGDRAVAELRRLPGVQATALADGPLCGSAASAGWCKSKDDRTLAR